MHFEEGQLYHIYNRGNNKQTIFFSEEDYLSFLEKAHLYLKPRCDIFDWCLMPNHFHFLVHANHKSIIPTPNINIPMRHLSDGIRLMLSSYAKKINEKYHRTGNLFQQKTKSKCVSNERENYPLIAFHYIHQNAMRAGLVIKMEDWEFSSFPDYLNLRKGNLCNKSLAIEMLDLNLKSFYEDSYQIISDEQEGKIL